MDAATFAWGELSRVERLLASAERHLTGLTRQRDGVSRQLAVAAQSRRMALEARLTRLMTECRRWQARVAAFRAERARWSMACHGEGGSEGQVFVPRFKPKNWKAHLWPTLDFEPPC